MQRTTSSRGSRLLEGTRRGCRRGSVLPAAILSASALLLATAPVATAQSGGWEHYDVSEPRVITIEFDTDLLAWDLCWSEHAESTREQIATAAISQMNDPAQLYVIDLPGLPPFYRRTSFAPVWHDLNGDVITSSNVLPNRWNYHLDVEQALIDIAGQIRESRPGAKLAFKNFEVQPLHNRPAAYTELGEVQDFYITDRTIYLNHVGHVLNHALNSAFFRARVDFAKDTNNWLVFPGGGGKYALASANGMDWPPAEFEPEILALWGGGDEPGGGGDIDGNGDGGDGNGGGGDGDGGGGGGIGGGGGGIGGGGGDDAGGPPLPPGDFVVLIPGPGWNGATAEPAAIGDPSDLGYDAKAIARWDVVPFQTFDNDFDIGVVAFHMNGIQRVDFSVEGGAWVSVNAPQYNARTGVIEYTVRLDPSRFTDGPIEVRAIAYPLVGEPRVLDSLELFSNANGSLNGSTVYVSLSGNDTTSAGTLENPFRSVAYAMNRAGTGGEVILLDAGFYSLEGSAPAMQENKRWVTVRGRDGLNRDQIVLGFAPGEHKMARLRADRIRFNNLTLDFGTILQFYSENNQHYWFDDVIWTDSLGWAFDHPAHTNINDYCRTRGESGQHGWFATNSLAYDATFGFSGANLVRNTHCEKISGDVFKDTQVVINATVRQIDGRVKDHHTDIIQFYSLQPNAIFYNISGYGNIEAQNIFTNSANQVRDIAFVNIAIDNEPGHIGASQLNCPHEHVLFFHVSIINQSLIMRDDWSNNRRFTANNVVLANSVLGQLSRGGFGSEGLPAGVFAYDNHFVSGLPRGMSYSTGPVNLNMPSLGNFSYSGSAASQLISTGSLIENLPVPDWDFGSSVAPNRGAFPAIPGLFTFNR